MSDWFRNWPISSFHTDQIGTYFNKVLISIVSLSGILTWTPHNDPFVAMYSQWLASGRPGGLLCVRLVWCGLYDGAAYLSTSESYLHDLGVVRLISRAAYSPEITVQLFVWKLFSFYLCIVGRFPHSLDYIYSGTLHRQLGDTQHFGHNHCFCRDHQFALFGIPIVFIVLFWQGSKVMYTIGIHKVLTQTVPNPPIWIQFCTHPRGCNDQSNI